MKKRIRNFTSTVSVENSVNAIERRLIEFGARNIAKDYDALEVAAVMFTIVEPKSQLPMTVRVPARVASVNAKLLEGKKWLNASQKKKIGEQAQRTAWKLMHDWIDVQLSLVAMDQAEPAQVFLPYIVMGGGQTFYEHLAKSEFKLLTDQRSEE